MNLVQNITPAVQTILSIVLGILTFFTVLFNIWKLIKDSSFVRLMLTRTYSWWVIFIAYILFFCVYPPVGHVGLCLLSLVCFREIVTHSAYLKMPRKLLWVCYLIIVLQFVATSMSHEIANLMIIPFVGMMLINIYCILFESIDTTVKDPPFLVWTMILTASGFAHLSSLYSLHADGEFFDAQGLLVYFLFLTQFNDVLQFIWGSLFGRHYISPAISPKKTWEGLVGAVFTTMILAYGLRFITPFTSLQSLIIGFLIPIFGFWGDLTISTLKRNLKVKDMGSVIPGHGGLLDRVDSILLSAIVYYYLVYFWIVRGA